MIFTASKSFSFSAGHKLVNSYSEKCKHHHGHNYKVVVELSTHFLNDDDMVMDFKKLSEIVDPIIEKFDHSYLNDFFKNPTAEILGRFIFNTVKEKLPIRIWLEQVTIWETDKCKIKIKGENDVGMLQ